MASEKELNQTLEELTILLMYLTRFRERKDELWQAWKGYDWTILDSIQEKEYISFTYKAKRVYLRDKGLKKMKELLRKYNISVKAEE